MIWQFIVLALIVSLIKNRDVLFLASNHLKVKVLYVTFTLMSK